MIIGVGLLLPAPMSLVWLLLSGASFPMQLGIGLEIG